MLECEIGVGLLLGFLGGARQIAPAGTGQEPSKDSLSEKALGGFPFLLASLHEVIVAVAAAAGRENELMRQAVARRRCGPPGRVAQVDSIEVAENRFGGIGTLAARTEEHSSLGKGKSGCRGRANRPARDRESAVCAAQPLF